MTVSVSPASVAPAWDALVLRNGQTVSVGEGDEIAPGYKVVGVTADAIVIQGPNSERKTFQRQGDRP